MITRPSAHSYTEVKYEYREIRGEEALRYAREQDRLKREEIIIPRVRYTDYNGFVREINNE